MHVAFDGSTLTPIKSGVGYYTQHLLQQLASSYPQDRLTVLSNQRVEMDFGDSNNLEFQSCLKLGWRLPWMMTVAPWCLRNLGADVAHFTNSICPPALSLPTVLTIHDMTLELMPHMHPRRRRLTRFLVRRSARRADAIIAVSHSARHHIIRLLDLPPDKVSVVYEAPASQFRPLQASALQRVRRLYGLDRPFVLHVGTVEPRKNLGSLLRAFAGLRAQGMDKLDLVLAGSPGWGQTQVDELLRRLDLMEQVRLLGYVPFRDLPGLYNLATVMVYPSLHEGFGLPVVEAMACGCPVITSNHSSLREIAHPAARLLQDTTPDSIQEAIGQVVGDPALQTRMARHSIQHAAGFSWEKAARETREIYRRVIGTHSGTAH